MKILYIEDNPADANLVSRYVRTTPHELVIVDNVDAAYSALDQQIDLVLIDLLINHQRSGYEVARVLRENEFNCPIVAVTALTTPNDLAAARQVGFDDVLPKPFQIRDLAAVIDRYAG